MTTPIFPPDLAPRPFDLTVERTMRATPDLLYRAWSGVFERWFAAPGTVRMTPAVDCPFYFEVRHEGQRYPHDGRFLRLEPDRLVELTWLTGTGGTKGAETVVIVELTPTAGGTQFRLSHAGFRDASSRDGHRQAWPAILAHLDDRRVSTE